MLKVFEQKPYRLALIGFFFALLTGCSTTPLQSDRLLEHPPTDLPTSIELTDTPFNAQLEYQCGPSSLATLLQWSGVDITSDQLAPAVFTPDLKGSLQIELVAAARRYNRIPYIINQEITSLLKEVQKGNPVLVMQNLGLDWLPKWHYAVVIGYDLNHDEIIIRSGTNKRHINSFSLFEQTWQRANYWGMVVLPANVLPATAEPIRYMSSIVAFEELKKFTIAKDAYETGLEKWPNDKNYLVALGNIKFTLNDIAGAEDAFRKTVKLWPNYGPALNNLAHILTMQNKVAEAEKHARHAIALNDEFRAQYEDTLNKILKLKDSQN